VCGGGLVAPCGVGVLLLGSVYAACAGRQLLLNRDLSQPVLCIVEIRSTSLRLRIEQSSMESLILAQDKRWRRA
jgi:hypothetical protein